MMIFYNTQLIKVYDIFKIFLVASPPTVTSKRFMWIMLSTFIEFMIHPVENPFFKINMQSCVLRISVRILMLADVIGSI